MVAPIRVRAAVATASLAGDVPSWMLLDDPDRSSAISLHRSLRSAGDRVAIAHAIAKLRTDLAPHAPRPFDRHEGAALYARWLRAVDAVTRDRAVRMFDERDLTAIASHARLPPLAAVATRTTTWLVAQGTRAHRRTPPTLSFAILLCALRGEGDVITPAQIAWERSIRVLGRHTQCAEFARTWRQS